MNKKPETETEWVSLDSPAAAERVAHMLANALSTDALAARLNSIASGEKKYNGYDKSALMREAAKRLKMFEGEVRGYQTAINALEAQKSLTQASDDVLVKVTGSVVVRVPKQFAAAQATDGLNEGYRAAPDFFVDWSYDETEVLDLDPDTYEEGDAWS